jgi:fatty-acid desaturase
MSGTLSGSGAAADPYRVNSLVGADDADPVRGVVRWDPVRSLWNGGMMLAALLAAPATASPGVLSLFVVLTALTLCLGHSVGMHRRLIHRAFDCPKWLERLLVEVGVLVGAGGPFWTIAAHDIRDWAQRCPSCHDYLAHRRSVWRDGWWVLHCRLELDRPPAFDPGPGIADDPFYRFCQRSWMLHQLTLAALLFWGGGWPWVVWGVFVRVTFSVTGHWLISYFAHRVGPQSWTVDGAGVQAHNLPWLALPTMGESWHSNHHAFPASARHGLRPGELDPGFWIIRILERIGLAWNVKTPASLPRRFGITAVDDDVMTRHRHA